MKPTTRDEREAQARDLLRALRTRVRSQNYRWGGKVSVEAGLLLEGSRFEFVQALRLLTRIARVLPQARTSGADASRSIADPNKAEPAALPMAEHAPEDSLLTEEAGASMRVPSMDDAGARFSLRLRSRVGFDFSPASIHVVRLSSEVQGEIEVVANLLPLAGNNAPLPEPYAETLLARQRARDMAMTDFLDIFHHRLLELYFATTLHTAPWLGWQHPATNELAQHLYAFAGLGPRDLRGKSVVPDRVWLKYAGLLWQRPRSAAAFRQIAQDHFKVPVRLGGAVGKWFAMEKEDRCRLGEANCTLGSATIGARVWLRDAGLLVKVGPVAAEKVGEFLPGGKGHREMREMARFFFEDKIELEIEIVSDAEKTTAARLGQARLGWTSWVRPEKEAGPLRLRVRAPKPSGTEVHHG